MDGEEWDQTQLCLGLEVGLGLTRSYLKEENPGTGEKMA